jgi:hypothetical protein
MSNLERRAKEEAAAELEFASDAGVVMAACILGANGEYGQGTIRMHAVASALEVLRDASSHPFVMQFDDVLEEFDNEPDPAMRDEALMSYWNRLVTSVEAGVKIFTSRYQPQFERTGIDDFLSQLAKKYRDDGTGEMNRKALVFGAIGCQTLDTEDNEAGIWSTATNQVKAIEHLAKVLKVRGQDIEEIQARAEGEDEVEYSRFSIEKYRNTNLDECEAQPVDE